MTNPAAALDRRAVFAWSLYDFANSSFTTLVVTFIYATYFTKGIAPDEITGTELWSQGITITALIVAVISPFAGALADRSGRRKVYLLLTTVVCVVSTACLFFPEAGEIYFALTLFVVANVCFEVANVFYNAFLPEIAPPSHIGRVSGYGWALGYVGGLGCLVVGLVAFVNPEVPWFGFAKAGEEHIRATNLLVAVWYGLFSIPLFLFVKDRPRPAVPSGSNLYRAAVGQLKDTFQEIRRFKEIFQLLLARLIYNDGVITIFAFGGIYAQGTFGFTTEEIIIFGIGLNIAAGLGAAVFGILDDRMGGKRTIMITLVGLFAATLLAVLAENRTLFWIAGLAVGLLSGPNQAASRSLLGRFTPREKENEFYGFFAFSGKFTAFLGPLLFGFLTAAFASQRAGVAVVMVFFIVGALLLTRVDEAEGIKRNQQA